MNKKNNNLIIDNFKKLIDYLSTDIDKKSYYKIYVFKNFISFVQKLNYDIQNSSDLDIYKNKNIGIGKGIIQRVDEILKYGSLNEIKKKVIIKNKFYKKLENIHGFGKQLINKLLYKYDITSIKQLKQMVKKKKIILSKNAIIGLKYYKKIKTLVPRNQIKKIIKKIKKIILNSFKSLKIKICGSYRRKNKYSNDIDILITQKLDIKNKIKFKNIINILKNNNLIKEEFQNDDVKTRYSFICNIYNNLYIIDIRFIDYDNYYSTLLFLTGSKQFNINLRRKAIKLGYKLNEYGIFNIYNNTKITVKSEKDIFNILNIPYIKPIDRNI